MDETSAKVNIVLLILLLALPIVSTDIYLPSMSAIMSDFGANGENVQFTLTAYFLVFSCVQLFYGFLSDLVGRRKVILGSLVVYVSGTLVCCTAHSTAWLICGRCLQGLGAGSAVVVFAIVRDLYSGHQAAKKLSLMSGVVALSPIIAPVIGGYLQAYLGWRANFLFLLVIGVTLLVTSVFRLRETKPTTTPFGIGSFLSNYRGLFVNPSYTYHALAAACAFGALFTYVSAAPFIFLSVFGYSPEQFGLIFAVAALGYVAGSLLNPILIAKGGLDLSLVTGSCALLAGGALMMLGAWSVTIVITAQVIAELGIAVVVPVCTTKALQPIPNMAGQGSALIGFLRFVCAGLASWMMAAVPNPMHMAAGIMVFGFLSTLGIWKGRRSLVTLAN